MNYSHVKDFSRSEEGLVPFLEARLAGLLPYSPLIA